MKTKKEILTQVYITGWDHQTWTYDCELCGGHYSCDTCGEHRLGPDHTVDMIVKMLEKEL